jgi:hypothetical protein
MGLEIPSHYKPGIPSYMLVQCGRVNNTHIKYYSFCKRNSNIEGTLCMEQS